MADETGNSKPAFQVHDRRFWVDSETSAEKAPIPRPKYPSFVEELRARTEAAEQKLEEKIERLDRENSAYRGRLDRQLQQRLETTKADFLRDVLEIVDNFERALDAADEPSSFGALHEGVRLNLGLLFSKLRAAGVEPLTCLGETFDPHIAEAIGVAKVDDPALDSKVSQVIVKGYRLGDQILRPAKVMVGQCEGHKGD